VNQETKNKLNFIIEAMFEVLERSDEMSLDRNSFTSTIEEYTELAYEITKEDNESAAWFVKEVEKRVAQYITYMLE
jgi:hypothetical protein